MTASNKQVWLVFAHPQNLFPRTMAKLYVCQKVFSHFSSPGKGPLRMNTASIVAALYLFEWFVTENNLQWVQSTRWSFQYPNSATTSSSSDSSELQRSASWNFNPRSVFGFPGSRCFSFKERSNRPIALRETWQESWGGMMATWNYATFNHLEKKKNSGHTHIYIYFYYIL